MSLLGHTEDANGNDIGVVGRIDGSTNAQLAIEYEHGEVHAGSSYIADIVNLAITAAEYIAIGFTTPPATSGLIHVVFAFTSEAAAHLELLEGPANTPASGVVLPAYNRRRDSGNVSGLVNLRSYDNAGVVGGTAIHDLYAFSDKRQTIAARDSQEFVLRPEEDYAIKLTADANGGGHVVMTWYEHTDRN